MLMYTLTGHALIHTPKFSRSMTIVSSQYGKTLTPRARHRSPINPTAAVHTCNVPLQSHYTKCQMQTVTKCKCMYITNLPYTKWNLTNSIQWLENYNQQFSYSTSRAAHHTLHHIQQLKHQLSCYCKLTCSKLSPPHHNRFMALSPGPPGWAGGRRELLDFMVQGKINRGRHTDHPAGCHFIRTNQCPPPPSPIFHRPDALPAGQPTVIYQCSSLNYQELF